MFGYDTQGGIPHPPMSVQAVSNNTPHPSIEGLCIIKLLTMQVVDMITRTDGEMC